jgi:hypothetical protein
MQRHVGLARPSNGSIIDVGQVHHLNDTIALVDEIAPQDVFEHEGAKVADVGIVVYCGATRIHADLTRMDRLKVLLAARQGVIEA